MNHFCCSFVWVCVCVRFDNAVAYPIVWAKCLRMLIVENVSMEKWNASMEIHWQQWIRFIHAHSSQIGQWRNTLKPDYSSSSVFLWPMWKFEVANFSSTLDKYCVCCRFALILAFDFVSIYIVLISIHFHRHVCIKSFSFNWNRFVNWRCSNQTVLIQLSCFVISLEYSQLRQQH